MPNNRFRATLLLASIAIALSASAPSASAWAQGSTATQTVDVMNKLWGRHPGMRANHAKGIVVEGNFTPTPEGQKLSAATLFTTPSTPVTVRFSDSTGLPTLPDGSAGANPHGMSIKFHLPGNAEMDVVTNSLAFFPVATGEEFRDLLQAISESGPEAPKPTKADQFIAAHPTIPAAFASAKTPSSFARETYNGVDAFILVDKSGAKQPFRFQFVPVVGAEHLDDAAAAKQTPDFLVTELPERVTKTPVAFRMMAQLANPGDQTKDPTQPWPADRRMVDLGTITLNKTVPDSATAEKALRFLPNRLTPGIEVSDDPLITARVQAYLVSFGRRPQ